MKCFVLFCCLAVSLAFPQGGNYGEHGHHEEKHEEPRGGSAHQHFSIQHPHHGKSYIEGSLKVEHPKEVHIKAHPHYHYDYKVHDQKTHDIKDKHEQRDGYHVKGSYSLHQPDHLVRHVEYESDKKQGFVAKVTYTKHH